MSDISSSMFDVSYVCEDCGKEYYAVKTYNRKMASEGAKRRLMIHLRTCKPAEEPKVKEKIKPTNVRGYCNCPVCNQVTRADRIVDHCISKHKDELSFSMDNTIRKEMRDLSLPVLWGFEPYHKSKRGARCLYACAHCKKGCFVHTKRPKDFDVTNRQLLEIHRECLEHFKTHEQYFSETSEDPVLLPFVCKKYLEGDLKRILEGKGGEKPEETTTPLCEVKEPESQYQISLQVLELKEEVARLKASLEVAQRKTLLSEEVKARLLEIVEPEETLGDEDLIEESVRAYKSLLKSNAKVRRQLEETEEARLVIQDVFANLLSADEGLAGVIVRTCTKEQNAVLKKYLKRV